MKEKAKKVAQHALNIASPIASTLSLLNPIFWLFQLFHL